MQNRSGDSRSGLVSLSAVRPSETKPSLSVLEIDLRNIAHNVRALRDLLRPGVRLCAVVKADAYGHGLVRVARTAIRAGADCLAIASVDEAARLRAAEIEAPLVKVVPGLPDGDEMEESLALGVEEVVCDVGNARRLARAARRMRVEARVHVNVDTGMGRQGILAAKAVDAVSAISRFRGLRIAGLMTHFAEADSADPSFTREQIRLFRDIVERLGERGIRPEMVHAANSAGLIHFAGAHFSMVRPGIAIYGAYPASRSREIVSLRQVMSFCTRVIQVRELPAGSSVGYGRTFRLEGPSRIATLPAGYADGLLRSLSNRGQVLIRGHRHPVAGRISMNLINVRVTDGVPVQVGDEAVLLGRQGNETITGEEMAAWAGTIAYEVFTSLGNASRPRSIAYHAPDFEPTS